MRQLVPNKYGSLALWVLGRNDAHIAGSDTGRNAILPIFAKKIEECTFPTMLNMIPPTVAIYKYRIQNNRQIY